MGQREERPMSSEEGFRLFSGIVFLVLTITCFVWLGVYISHAPTSRPPDYTVAITGAAGLDLAPGGGPALSPVFNLTVRIDNNASNPYYSACVRGLSTAVVSYGDAPLGRGSVSPFCAEEGEVQERAATAWGQDVALPRFLRERLAGELGRGEAAVDVQVTTPADCYKCSDTVLVCGRAKIGGDPAPCRLENVYTRPAPAASGSGSA